eukprot:13848790-Alexandrium_andersonii.AAC.1
MQTQMIDYVDKEDMRVLASRETRLPTTTQFVTGHYMFVLCGGRGHERIRRGGVRDQFGGAQGFHFHRQQRPQSG